MRIATSTIYDNQSSQIDNLTATYQQQGAELSSGISLNVPSDNPTVIAQDLSVRTDIGISTQLGKNFSDLQNELTTTDGALANLTNVLQSARALAIQGASGAIGSSRRTRSRSKSISFCKRASESPTRSTPENTCSPERHRLPSRSCGRRETRSVR